MADLQTQLTAYKTGATPVNVQTSGGAFYRRVTVVDDGAGEDSILVKYPVGAGSTQPDSLIVKAQIVAVNPS